MAALFIVFMRKFEFTVTGSMWSFIFISKQIETTCVSLSLVYDECTSRIYTDAHEYWN